MYTCNELIIGTMHNLNNFVTVSPNHTCFCMYSLFIPGILQVSSGELSAKSEETRGQLGHLDQEVL